jgi:hypothetical protein
LKSQILPQIAKLHNESGTKNNTIHDIDCVNSYEADGEEKNEEENKDDEDDCEQQSRQKIVSADGC